MEIILRRKRTIYVLLWVLFWLVLFSLKEISFAATVDVMDYPTDKEGLIETLSLQNTSESIYENISYGIRLSEYMDEYFDVICDWDDNSPEADYVSVYGITVGSSREEVEKIFSADNTYLFSASEDGINIGYVLVGDSLFSISLQWDNDKVSGWIYSNFLEFGYVAKYIIDAQIKYGSIHDCQWKKDIIEYIYDIEDTQITGLPVNLYLAYVNDDNIPELYVHTDGTASGDRMCTWSSDGIKEQFIWTGCGSYIERANLFAEVDGGHMGLYTDKIYSIDNNDFKSVADGERIEIDGRTGTFERFQYKWNDVEVTESEYDNSLKSVYDSSKAIKFKDENELSFEEIIEKIVAVDESDNSQSTQQENENLKERLITKEYEAEYHSSDYGKGTILIKYDENDFFSDSSIYNHHLACYAASLSTLVYSEHKEHLINVLNEFEYNNGKVEEKNNYFPDKTIGNGAKNKGIDEIGMSSPCYIVHKSLKIDGKKTDIITLIIRGTSDEEWINNFKIGKGSDVHEGFQYACDDIKSKLEKYISDNNLEKDDIRLLITGHSRGAAVANLLGASIDDDGISNTNVKPSDVYVYTFATPNTTAYQYASVDPFQKEKDNSVYNNINNIVNPEDFVTKVVPSKWGFRRYGCTYVLPSKSTDTLLNFGSISYSVYLLSVNDKFKRYTNDGTLYIPYDDGMESVSKYIRNITFIVKDIDQYYNKNLNSFAGITKDKHLYSLEELFKFVLGGKCSNNSIYKNMADTVIANAAKTSYGIPGINTLAFFGLHHMVGEKIHETGFKALHSSFRLAHTSETYLAQMNTINEKDLMKKRKMLRGIVNCPVDVTIKDENGNVVGEIRDNQVNEDIEDGIVMSVDGDSKNFTLPPDESYTVELSGNDNGTMDYSLSYVDADTGEIERTYYQDVPVEEGKTYIQEVKSGDIPQDVKLINANNDVVEVTENIDEEAFGKLTVEVTVEGVGYADSLYGLTPGDYVTLSAVADQNNSFLGWYDENGTLVSDDKDYSFSIQRSMKFTAKFTDIFVNVSSITFDKERVTMEKGDTAYNIPKVEPDNATSSFLIFESSNPNVVEVDEYGLLTAIEEGEATINAKSVDGNAEASFEVTVSGDENISEEGSSSVGKSRKISPLIIAGIISLFVIILITVGIIIFNARKEKYFTERTLYGGNDVYDAEDDEPETEIVGLVIGLFGVSEGQQFILRPGQACTVGKSSECNFQIKSKIVSRLHCTIRMLSEDVFEVIDHSTNGTFYNNVRVEQNKPMNIPKDSILAVGNADNIIQLQVQERKNIGREVV